NPLPSRSSLCLAATAQVATQQGAYLGHTLTRLGSRIQQRVKGGEPIQQAIEGEVKGESTVKGFAYTHRGSLAYV
ncbi:hypothetical protein HDU93_004717, partial [Gonapodya sp. JEL0774]